jgi:hypothetical protein
MDKTLDLERMFAHAAQKAVTPAEAQALFEQLRDLPLCFGESENGCQSRAHLMCAYMRDKGIVPYKAWVVAEDGNDLRFKVDLGGTKRQWWFHVAPAVLVRLPDRKTDVYVLDPALFSLPVTREVWAREMRATRDDVVIRPYMQRWYRGMGNFSPNEFYDSDEKMRNKAMSHIHCIAGPSGRFFAKPAHLS